MDPIYDKQRNRMDVVFRSNDQLMDTVSDISASILEVQESWTESELDQSGKPASREGLMHATLHYFQAASVDEEEIGDLSRDKMPSPRLHRFGFAEASTISSSELNFIHRSGWETLRNFAGDLLIGYRTNLVGSKMRRLAGSTLVEVAHKHLPLAYMTLEIIYGKTLPISSQGNRAEFLGHDSELDESWLR
ncbi:hypothetical protein AK812_SmicGene3052 [Symbiodinium microadriaticum]|uniref:Uncharacterized protein n=1 Tax=Symbiodinium microadriaticum TaxID=2951 RepID=A0A1Q9EZZ3_SYMMI|nr:hypothetical protein AK812_SmicGene3052 [Symbiodinium microadriaticum]CAE7216893.1 unnamed protein product [Symbiodinium microadriaticum]